MPTYLLTYTHGNAGCCFLFGHRRHPAAWRNTLTELTRNCTLHFDSAAHNTLLLLTIARGIVSLVSQPESLPFQRHCCSTKRFSPFLPNSLAILSRRYWKEGSKHQRERKLFFRCVTRPVTSNKYYYRWIPQRCCCVRFVYNAIVPGLDQNRIRVRDEEMWVQ